MAELVLSAFLQVLFDRLAPRAGDLWNLARRQGLEKKLEAFVTMFRDVDAVLADAEDAVLADAEDKKRTKESLKLWLKDLKELAYDTEDVLDEFSTEALRLKVMEKQQPTTCCFTPSALKFKFKMGSKMDDIMSRLEDISKRKDRLSLVGNGGGASGSTLTRPEVPLPTTSFPLEAVLYGRVRDRAKIIDLLLKDDQSCDVIPIVAMGGTGKTTLAQHVFGDPAVAQAFHSKAWVCVSNDDFDVIRVMKAILEKLTLQSCELKELETIKTKLKDALNGKRFLIVLDDIWDHTFTYEKWLHLKSLFEFGASGSKMIVTTRQEKVATTVGHPYKLELLSDNDCWLLFESHALNNRDDHVALHQKTISEKVVAMCKGLPLAARTLGGVLRSKPIDEWEDILNNKIWHTDGDALPVLRLSYHYLSPQLKKCFSHCAIFPQDYKFTQEELVLLWVAEGLIQLKGDEGVIHKGHEYFRELISRSLFQATSDDNSEFIMHDLVHDLAQQVGGETYFRLDDATKPKKDQERVRHSSHIAREYDISKRFEFFHKTKRLRTFLPLRDKETWRQHNWLANSVLFQMLQLKKLRVLSFSRYQIYELPDSIGNSKHLRHLDLSETGIRCLPESTCSLYNLLILSLKDCKSLQKLPSKMENLTSLCYLDIRNADGLQEMPVGLKELKSLQVLSNFIVGKGHGCMVKELKSFKDLSGTLCISNLENVVRAIEAKEASLNVKKNLEALVLKWGSGSVDSRNGENEKCVLEMLQPNQNLKKLTISYYAGNAFSTWLGDLSFSSMKFLRLENCNRCTCLPPLGQLPSLKTLEIIGMHAVKSVGDEFYGSTQSKAFPSLESLSFKDMPEWEKWSGFEVNEQIEGFSCLSVLSIEDCPKLLGNLPNHIPSLKRLVVLKCEKLNVLVASFPKVCELDIDGCQEIANGSKQLAIDGNGCEEMVNRNLPCTLECLKMRDCQTPKRLPMAFCSASRLEMISIDGCSCLVSLPIALFLLPVLEEVEIYNCENLRTLIDEVDEDINSESSSTTVGKKLSVRRCPSLECLSSTSTLPGLITRLSVEECSKLEFVAKTLPTSLTSLEVEACSGLEFLVETFLENTKLESIEIENCQNFQRLPECLQLLSHLIRISIDGCPKLEQLPNLPISLTQLDILECENLTYQSSSSCFQNLTSLQYLYIHKCPKLNSLPNLPISLTELHIEDCENLTYQSSSSCFQNLTSLQSLWIWGCPKLKSLPNLPISLTKLDIRGCENLTYQSSSSCFQNLTSLQSLSIWRCPKLNSLPNLPISLTKLEIRDCENLTYQSSSSCFQNLTSLQSLSIDRCPKLNSLPNLPISLTQLDILECENLTYQSSSSCFQNLTSLQSLWIWGCPKLKSLPNLPISLTKLDIRGCENLTYQSSSSCFQNLTSLQSLSIWRCPKLNSLPNLPISLTKLEIRDCENLTYQSSSSCFQNLTSLQSLSIDRCPKLNSLPNLPISLTELHIEDCENLTYQSSSSCFQNLTSLQSLDIWRCPKLKSLPNLPISLTKLKIWNCENLTYQSSSSCFQNLTSLQSLSIDRCPKLNSLPKDGLPPSLLELYIYECPLLKKRCKRDKGKDWQKIADVPVVWIDYKHVRDPK